MRCELRNHPSLPEPSGTTRNPLDLAMRRGRSSAGAATVQASTRAGARPPSPRRMAQRRYLALAKRDGLRALRNPLRVADRDTNALARGEASGVTLIVRVYQCEADYPNGSALIAGWAMR